MPGIIQRAQHAAAPPQAERLVVRPHHPAARRVVQLRMREERVFDDTLLLTLGCHHVHGVVQHGLSYLRRGCRHDNLCGRVFVLQAGQGADVIQMGVRHKDGIRVCRAYQRVIRLGLQAFLLGVHAGIQHHARAVHIQQVAVGAYFRCAGEIGKRYHGVNARRVCPISLKKSRK